MARLPALLRFILRNTDLFPADHLARFLDLPESSVHGWISALGLPRMRQMDAHRVFPIALRRNHDLLSEQDIARLLEMPLEYCAKLAQEMDFLDIKLGPRPSDLPTIDAAAPAVSEAAEQFRERCAVFFEDYQKWESPFAFVDALALEEQWDPGSGTPRTTTPAVRIMGSYTGSHGDFLMTGEDYYNEGILSRLRNRGVNAAWMPGLLRDLAPSRVFPEFGEGHEVRLENLRRQVKMAAMYGVRLFLYLNEPRFVSESLFAERPTARGMPAPQAGHYGMCTSDEWVRDWITEAATFLFRSVPDLGGVILITASENETNCYSHPRSDGSSYDGLGLYGGGTAMCPRCKARGAGPVLSDVAVLMSRAARAARSSAQVIQWLWGWDLALPIEALREAAARLPSDVSVMIDWAKDTRFSLFGKEAVIGEYTLARVRPSDYAVSLIKVAKDSGHRVFSRCAVSTTVEMNALPYLPVMLNVQRLLEEHRKHGLDGVFGCWIFGAYPSRNMELLAHIDDDQPATTLARKYYGSGADEALAAWRAFSDAMDCYPSVVSVLYLSAVNPGPGLRFSLEPEPWRHGMVAMASERIEEISGPLGAEVMIRAFRATAEGFQRGIEHLDRAIALSDRPEWHEENTRDRRICEACMRHLVSAANYSEFIVIRDRWLADRANPDLTTRMAAILAEELENARGMLCLTTADSRIGYEGAIGYFYTPVELVEKIFELEASIDELKLD